MAAHVITSAIEINDLRVDCIVGIREREQRSLQPLIIDARLSLPLDSPANTGDLTTSVNYSAISKQLAFVAAHGQWGLLESLASALASHILLPPAGAEGRAQVRAVEVRIRKPDALKGLAVPAVRLCRTAPEDGAGGNIQVREVCEGVRLDVLEESPLGAAYRLRLAPSARVPLPNDDLAAHVLAGGASLSDGSKLKEGDVLPRGSGAVLHAGSEGLALLLVGRRLPSGALGGSSLTTAYIALGSNLGDRAAHATSALRELRTRCGEVTRVSQLYVTAPQHVIEQPDFLNAACELRTALSPAALLVALKGIERDLGRSSGGVRYGPRVIDLDLLLYGDRVVECDTSEGPLSVPHKLLLQRTFVLAPLCDVAPAVRHPLTGRSIRLEFTRLCTAEAAKGERLPQRVLPVRADVIWPLGARTYVMAILNLTPDSFSDGGRALDTDVHAAVAEAKALVEAGADLVDLGAESTRPGAERVTEHEEMRRLLPVIRAIRDAGKDDAAATAGAVGGAAGGSAGGWGKRVVLSVDTTRASVAAAAVAAGADIINDISGGTFDEGMVQTMATLGVPYIAMHTRGTPKTMRSLASYPGGQVTSIVCDELERVVRAAHAAGLAPWSLIADPGIGFAKDPQQSMTLLHELPAFVQRIVGAQPGGGGGGGGGCCASLVGASRKGFIGQVLSQPDPLQRQWGNAATTVAATVAGVDIVRVHEVSEMRQVAMMADAIHRRAGGSGGAAPTPLAKL